MLQVGESVGAYRILEHIGSGSMGEVYLAEHTVIGRRVALKTIRPVLADHINVLFHEARATNQIAHPNIIQITDLVGGDGATPSFLVMEYLDGFPLSEVLEQEHVLEPVRVLEIAAALSDAMAAAHRAGVIHRDLKPDNVFLCNPMGAVKILDFGLALPVGAVDEEPVACGTPMYISPEQAGADEVDERTDIYSLGAMLYEALAGRPVFDHDSVRELLTAHIADRPTPLELVGYGPGRLADLVMRCLEKSPDDRPSSMDAIQRELTEIEAGWDAPRDPELDRLIDTMWDEPPRLAIAW